MAFPEDNLQMAVATYLDYIPDCVWFHVANERKTSQSAGVRLKKKGVKSGVPDIMILTPKKGFTGLAIELKIKPNTATPSQKKWLKKLQKLGFQTAICYDLDEAISIIDEYFK